VVSYLVFFSGRRLVCSAILSSLVDPITHIDNEYSRAGIMDPKIVITTSRDPSSKLLQYAKVCGARVGV
jgi:hypothetical protein